MKIKRSYFNMLTDNLNQPEINILLGARQVGKSTLLADLHMETKKKWIEFNEF